MKKYTHLLAICFISLIFLANNAIGASKQAGKDFPAAKSTPIISPTSTSTQNINIMIMARQHGNEPAGGTAIFSFINDLINSTGNSIDNTQVITYDEMIAEINKIKQIKSSALDIQVSEIGKSIKNNSLYLIKVQPVPGNKLLPSGVTLFFIPIVNPDGAIANNRNNANRKNLNRDWDDLTQPETQVVYNKVFKVYNPEIVLDLHEFSAFDYRQFDMTYYPGFGDESPVQLIALYTAFEQIVDQELKNKEINCDKISSKMETWVKNNTTFGGNHFAIKDFAINYTIETKGIPAQSSLPPIEYRVKMQRTFFETMIAYAAANKTQIIDTISKLRTGK